MFHVKRWLVGLLLSGAALACPGQEAPAPKPTSEAWLKAHNDIRAKKGIRPLVWNKGLEKHARQWARHLAKDGCKLYHSRGSGWGENLAMSGGYGRPRTPFEVTANMWASEEQWYNYKNNSCAKGRVCGHYTQVVWKNSSDVGCWTAKGPGTKSSYIYACNYDPPGNFRGQKPYYIFTHQLGHAFPRRATISV